MAVHITRNFARYRLRDPKDFEKLRIKDVGRKGHTKFILGKVKGRNEWKIQAILISIADYKKGMRVRMNKGRPIIVKM